jgi:hypothetical protein
LQILAKKYLARYSVFLQVMLKSDSSSGGHMSKFSMIVFLALCLGGCSTGIPLQKYAPQNQPKDNFTFCYGYSCTSQKQTGFTDKEWAEVQKIFEKKPAKSADAERVKIAEAIAHMEKIVGAKTGTSHDLPEARGKKEDPAQMDCIDETMNTSRYLSFMQNEGLLKFHTVGNPVHRGYFVDGAWPHNTAVIVERESGMQYAVDSFYRANGEEPYIMPATNWLLGWKPPGAKQ